MTVPRSRRHAVDSAMIEQHECDAVACADVVLGDCAGGAHRYVQTRRTIVDAATLADVGQSVDEQDHVAIMIGPRRGDMQRARSQRLRPVDAAQSVTRLEWSNACELGPVVLSW